MASDRNVDHTIIGTPIHSGWRLWIGYPEYKERIENFKVRDDDVWLCGYPKCGTTWSQEMIWCINSNLDYEKAKEPIFRRFPYFDLASQSTDHKARGQKVIEFDTESMDYLDQMPSPRHLKTHLPYDLLPRALREKTTRAKIVHIRRNPKDTCISNYHFLASMDWYHGTLDEFAQYTLDDQVIFNPFWEHVMSFVNKKDFYGDQMLFLTYEDMKADLASVVRKAANFLGKPQPSPEEMSTLLEHLSFQNMKVNPAVNRTETFCSLDGKTIFEPKGDFIRKGETGQWRTTMSPELIQKFDERTSKTFNF